MKRNFIKSLYIDDSKITLLDRIHDLLFYNGFVCFLRKVGRFFYRLPSYLKLCWINEPWDYEGLYNFIEVFLKQQKQEQQRDTWHEAHGNHRAIQQIDLTLAHLDRFRNWPDYYEWPEPKQVELPDGCFTLEYEPEDEAKCKLVHEMEEKNYNKFWKLLKKYHNNWWT